MVEKIIRKAVLLFFVSALLIANAGGAGAKKKTKKEIHRMKITSPEFQHNGYIPSKFTCEGEGINPALIFESIPEGTKSLVLIMDDPDAPARTFVHWVVYDMPVIGMVKEAAQPPGIPGKNSAGEKGYMGPCPPSGAHRYYFKLYALNKKLGLKKGAFKQQVEDAMRYCIIEKAELMGLYKKIK